MIAGTVNDFLEARLPVELRGPLGLSAQVDAVLDTGFSDELILPSSLIAALGLRCDGAMASELADGSVVDLPMHPAEIRWDGAWREVTVLGAEGDALVGTSLLYSYRLTMDILEGAPLAITPLP